MGIVHYLVDSKKSTNQIACSRIPIRSAVCFEVVDVSVHLAAAAEEAADFDADQSSRQPTFDIENRVRWFRRGTGARTDRARLQRASFFVRARRTSYASIRWVRIA